MVEYIEREKAFDLITDFAGQASTKSAYSAFWKSAKAIKKLPTADVVEVVRCKDCQSYGDFDTTKCKRFEFHFCDKFGIITKESDFCSFGVRKEGADNG